MIQFDETVKFPHLKVSSTKNYIYLTVINILKFL